MDPMKVNVPDDLKYRLYVKCVDDGPSIARKPFKQKVVKGQCYMAYSDHQALNGNGDQILCFYIKDLEGNKIEPHEGVPAWTADRFVVIGRLDLN